MDTFEEMVQFVLNRAFNQVEEEKHDGRKREESFSGEALGSEAMTVNKLRVGKYFFEMLNQTGIQIAGLVTL
jgi:hypothetical protein